MLDDIPRRRVLKSEPAEQRARRNWLHLCKFVSQSTPAVGGRFTDYFTDARIESWVNGSAHAALLRTHFVRTGPARRILRGTRACREDGPQPAKSRLDATLEQRRPCSDQGRLPRGRPSGATRFRRRVLRRVVDDSGDGARFERTDQGMILRTVDGRALPLLASPVNLEMVRGASLRDGTARGPCRRGRTQDPPRRENREADISVLIVTNPSRWPSWSSGSASPSVRCRR